MKSNGILIFDMDGVLIDVSGSYRETIRRSVRLFFRGADGYNDLPDPLFSLSDLARVKQSGGLNNDWDLTHYVIQLLCALIKIPQVSPDDNVWHRYRETISNLDLTRLARYLKTTADPLNHLQQKYPEITNDFIQSLYAGDVGSGNIIKQFFQEIYLGKNLFESTYGIAPKVYKGEGYIHKEGLLIEKPMLEAFLKINTLAIATGRPRAEAAFPLQKFGIGKYFAVVFTLDDCLREEEHIFRSRGHKTSLSKPHPFMLDAIVQKIGPQVNPCYYVGDMPDDMRAASRSKFQFHGIGITISTPDKPGLAEKLLQAGADHVVEDFQALKKLLKNN